MATLSCHKFGSQGVGVDVLTDPGDLPNSGVIEAYNLYLKGTNYVSRPAIKGLLTTPMAHPIWGPFPYEKSDGTFWVIFCSGPANSTTGGKIYQMPSTGGVATEILDASNGSASFNIDAQAFRIAQGGSYAYMVWGSTLYRTNLAASTAAAVSSLNPPVFGPSASLTNLSLDALSSTTGWSADTIATNWAYTDLVIGSTTTHVSSVLRPFMQSDVGQTLHITGGTGFTVSTPTINSVTTAGVAILSGSAGTASSTGGTGTLAQLTTGSNYLVNGQSDIEGYSGSTIDGGQVIPPATTVGTSWTTFGGGVSCLGTGSSSWALNHLTGDTIPPGYTGASFASIANTWLALDIPLEGVQTFPLQVGQLAAPNAYRNVNQFYVGYNWMQTDPTSKQGILVTMYAYADAAATILIGVATDLFIPQYSNQSPGQTHGAVLTFPGLTTQIQSIVVSIGGAPANVSAGSFAHYYGYPCASNVSVAPIATGTNGTAQYGNTFTAQTPGILISHGEPSSAFWGMLAGERVTRDYGAGNPENWSASSVITFNLMSAPGSALSVLQLVEAGLSMSLILRQSGSTTEYAAPLSFSDDGTYMSTDLSAYVPVTIYAAFEYMTLQFSSNLAVTESTSALFVITSITHAGNLPISQSGVAFAPVTYIVEELDNFGDATYADPLESSGSPPSNAAQPSPVFAVGQVVVSPAINPATTGYAVFRGGGTYDDGLYRLVATVPAGSDLVAPILYDDLVIEAHPNEDKVSSVNRPFEAGDVGEVLYFLAGTGFNVGPLTVSSVAAGVATLSGNAGLAGSTAGIAQLGGDPLTRDLQNPYVTWDHATLTLTDNTPDSFLNLALTYQFGRDVPPASCSGVVFHQNRVCVWDAETLSIGWDTVADAQNGVYFTLADLTTDPFAANKGITYDIGPGDNDPIQSCLSAGDMLLVLKGRSAAVVQGYDPTNFADQSYLTEVGLGCAASRSAIVCGNASRAWFVASDDVYQFGGNNTDPKGLPIQPLLHPDGYDGGPTIDMTAFDDCAAMYYDQRFLLFAPEPAGTVHPDGTVASGTQNSICHVYDFRYGTWSQWGLAMTSGRSLTGATSGTGAFMGGYDGQLYTFGAGGDTPLLGGAQNGITFQSTSRGMGEEQQTFSPTGEVGMNFIEPNKASRLYVMGKMPAGTELTLFCYADDNPGGGVSVPYVANGGRFSVQEKVDGVQGQQIFVGVSGTVTSQATIRALGAEVEKRKIPR